MRHGGSAVEVKCKAPALPLMGLLRQHSRKKPAKSFLSHRRDVSTVQIDRLYENADY